jgi:hypothetical protein
MTARDIDRLRAAIDRAGGLVTLADLARLWGVSTQRAHQIAEANAFPEPVATVGGRKLWATAQLAGWRGRE